jgi:hypothetical protein
LSHASNSLQQHIEQSMFPIKGPHVCPPGKLTTDDGHAAGHEAATQ